MSSFLPKAAIGVCLVAVVVAGAMYATAPTKDEATITDAPATPAEQSTLAEGPTTDQPEARVADAAPFDPDAPVVVPDGSLEELTAFVGQLQQSEDQARQLGPEVYFPYLRKVKHAMLEASDKILQANPEGDALTSALVLKLDALRTLGLLNQIDTDDGVDYWTQTVDAFNEISEKYPDQIDDGLTNYKTYAMCFQTKNMNAEEAAAVVQEIKADMLAGEIDSDDVTMARTLCMMLETPGKFELAAQTNRDFAKLFRDHGDGQIAPVGDMFDQTADVLELIGSKAEIAGLTSDRKEVDIADYKGKIVLVDFWATWCGPCLQELPNVLKNYEAFHEEGFDVLGISLDNSRDEIDTFLKSNELPWVTLVSDLTGGSGFENSLASRYNVQAIPFTMLVDREGNIFSVRVRGEELQRQLETLLGKPAETAATGS